MPYLLTGHFFEGFKSILVLLIEDRLKLLKILFGLFSKSLYIMTIPLLCLCLSYDFVSMWWDNTYTPLIYQALDYVKELGYNSIVTFYNYCLTAYNIVTTYVHNYISIPFNAFIEGDLKFAEFSREDSFQDTEEYEYPRKDKKPTQNKPYQDPHEWKLRYFLYAICIIIALQGGKPEDLYH